MRRAWDRCCDIGLLERQLIVYSLVSGGFAVVQPGSQLSINAVEGFPIEDFSAEAGPLHDQPGRDANGHDRQSGISYRRHRRSPTEAEASRT